MRSGIRTAGAVLAGALIVAGCTPPEPTGAENFAEEQQLQGRRVYRQHCAGCHGVDGKGEGPAAAFLDPRPRDFTAAVYKFRTTPSTFLPTDNDLMRTLVEGVHSTSMPSWRMLSVPDREAVIAHLKTFSENWKDPEYLAPSMALPGAPYDLKEDRRVAAGAKVYVKASCYSCHGVDGSGKGAANRELYDHKERLLLPLDFSKKSPKGGARPEDYYRAFTTGLDGSPMPVYGDILTTEERWDLVAFVMALRRHQGQVPVKLLPEKLIPEGSGS